MPIIKRPLKESHKSILRPVVLGVVADLIKIMEWDENAEIIFRGNSELAMLPASFANNLGVEEPNRTAGSSRIFINVEEEQLEDQILTIPVAYSENRYCILDSDLKIGLKPVYARHQVTIQMAQRFRSKAKADAWYGLMTSLIAQLMTTPIHNVSYHASVDNGIVSALREFSVLKENIAGYNETFFDWMNRVCSPRMTITTDSAGNNLDLSLAESNNNIQGDWDFQAPPKPVKANELGNWRAEISYKFEYDKPITWVFQYPIGIHQQLLDLGFIPKRRHASYEDGPWEKPGTLSRADYIYNQVGVSDGKHFQWHAHPSYNEWYPKDLPDGGQLQAVFHLQLDPNDARAICNLRELGEYELDESVLSYFRYLKQRIFRHRASAIQVCVYQEDIQVEPECLEIDDDLNIRCKWDLDMRLPYNLVIYLDADVVGWHEITVGEFLEDGFFSHKILGAMYPSLINGQWWPPINEKGGINPLDWHNFVAQLKYTVWNFGLPTDIYNTKLYIGGFTIFAKNVERTY